MAKPAVKGPRKLETEKPSDSQPKLSLRFSPLLPSPMACCTEMWKNMNATPHRAAEA